ncbi:MAG: hypothetical protein EOO28_33080 [Comamonadaceae bacterium]|nr:MAG: hypothetical protein EOO28_33080 [Comamonadaceae bacterium]
MTPTFCPIYTNRIHNKARLCLHCLAARHPSRLRTIPSHLRMPALDSRLLPAWAYPFQLIEKAGGADLPRWRRLSWLELVVVFVNPLALVFGPLYLLHLGLWRRAVATTAMWVLMPAVWLLLINHAVALLGDLPTQLSAQWLAVRPLACFALWLMAALAFAVRVNRDFCRKLEREEVETLYLRGDWAG